MKVAELTASPAIYPHTYDARGARVMTIRLSEADYRTASFLDDRILAPGMAAAWVPLAGLAEAMQQGAPHPLHFIFHTGHVGSTLVSRLLGELPGILGLREPQPLRILADMKDAAAPDFAVRADTFLRLWSRGFADTKAVIVKATSVTGRLAPALLAAAPDAKGIYLSLAPEPYLAAVLAAASGLSDLKLFARARWARFLPLASGAPVPETGTPGELAAIAWAVEEASRQAALAIPGRRILAVDFEALLDDLPKGLGKIVRHLELDAPPAAVRALAQSPVLTRYSKAPETHTFSPDARAAMMSRARREHAREIAKGMDFLVRYGLGG